VVLGRNSTSSFTIIEIESFLVKEYVMRILTEKINLDLNQNGIQATIDLREGDIESRLIIATLRGHGDAFRPDDNVIAVIRAKKPDGTIIFNNCVVEDGKVKFLITSQYAAVEGNYNACIEIVKNGEVLYTPKFAIHVSNNELSDSEVESSSEYTELTTALEQALTAFELAQNLHLIQYVDDLEVPGDSKYLYVLEDSAPYFTMTDFPTAVSSGTMFESTDETYPLLLFTGMILQEDRYEDTGVVQFRSFVNPSATGEQTSMFGYDVANEKWVKLQDFDYYGDDALNTGDELILTDEAAGEVHDPVVTDYVIKSNPKYEVEPTRNTRVVYIYDNEEHQTIYYYIFTSTGNISFTEDSNVIDLDNIPDVLVGNTATPYVYDELLNKYIPLCDTDDLKQRVANLESEMSDAEGNISNLQTRMTTAEGDIDSLEANVRSINDELDFYITINHTSTNPTCNKNYNQINQSLSILMYINPRIKLVYKDSNNNLCYAVGTWQIQNGFFTFWFNTSEKTKTETRVYQLNTNNTWSVTINNQTNQAKLVEGNNVTIDNTDPDNPIISATDTTYSVGNGLKIDSETNQIDFDFLTNATGNVSGLRASEYGLCIYTGGTNPCIDRNANGISVSVKSDGGISKTNNGLTINIKENSGVVLDSNELSIDKNTSLEIDTNNKLGVAGSILNNIVNNTMIGTASGSIASFTDGADDMPLKSCMVDIEPVQSGSGDTSPSNVRPISGWTECNISDVGTNLFDKSKAFDGEKVVSPTGVITNNPTWARSDFISIKQNTNYYTNADGTNQDYVVTLYDKNKNYIGYINTTGHSSFNTGNAYYVILSTLKERVNIDEMVLNYPATDTSYHAYKGNIYNIEFKDGTNPLTVYGGTLDVINGVLIVTDGYIASYNGETLPSTWISSMDVYAEGTTPTTGAEVVYKLATPQTYNVTPTEVKTLLGINNIFADCGDIENVEYTRDATSIINYILSKIENI
jgi:hypothetical protein